MMLAARCRASAIATPDLPAAVGPQMTRSGSSATLLAPKPSLDLVPGQQHDGRPSVHVVRWQRSTGQREIQRLHLRQRELITALDSRLARECRGELLMPPGTACQTIAGQRSQSVAQ